MKRRAGSLGLILLSVPSCLGSISLAILAVLLSGCVGLRPDPILRTGPGADFDSAQVKTFQENQEKVLQELYVSADLTEKKAPTDATGWGKVINAGLNFADERCEAYMHALFRLYRDKNTAVAQIGLVGAASAGLQAAVSATARTVAATAILFGLGASTVENYSSNLLYELEPSSVRTLVKGLQAGYRAGLPSPPAYNTKPAAMAVIRGYATLCVPANIEAEVNLAVKKSVPSTQSGDAEKGQPPSTTHSDVVAVAVPAATRAQATVFNTRVDKLLDRVSNLQGASALKLANAMPLSSDSRFAEFVEKNDSGGRRFTHAPTAVAFAKAWLVLTAKTEESVAQWEQALAPLK